MKALFPRWTNTVSRLTVAALLATPAVGVGALMLYVRSPLNTGQFAPVEQPIQFDHRHHVGDDGIDCRYCHQTVESAPYAGYPATAVCIGCHAQVWNKSPMLDRVRQSYFADRPITWRRVNRVPDFVYFNHSIHVNKGVGCVTCHGRVDQMAAVQQVAPLSMGWCLDCHRNPAQYLRPREVVTRLEWEPSPEEAQSLGPKLAQAYQVKPRTNCTTCHR